MRLIVPLLCLSFCAPLLAADPPVTPVPPEGTAPAAVLEPSAPEQKEKKPDTWWTRFTHCDDGTDRSRGWLRHFASGDRPVSPMFGTPCDVDWHKPIFILPYTYSPDYDGRETEVLFSVSAKLRPLGLPLYFAYSQRSYWQVYDSKRSRPFRETVYNPEFFYRWAAPAAQDARFFWGTDAGYEHESNGQDIPESRSWDRLYVAPYFERGGTAVQLKVWYRLPEDEKKDDEDAKGDDNPDIDDYMGYSELHVYRRFNPDKRLHVMARLHPGTGNGAIQAEYSWRIGDGDLFWNAYVFHGYGESLTDYNDSVTRVGIGFALAR